MKKLELWEILVPTIRNNGRPIRLRFHKVWDNKVREISGGLTVLQPVKGQWIDNKGNLLNERMIPVRFLANRNDVDNIIDMTMEYYEQESILAYQISNNVILKER